MGIMPMFDKGAILNPVAAFQKQLELAFVTLLKKPHNLVNYQ